MGTKINFLCSLKYEAWNGEKVKRWKLVKQGGN